MIKSILKSEALTWVDVTDPDLEEIQRIATEQGLHQHFVQDCLEPEHLPKIEDSGDSLFIILRVYDTGCAPDAATATELTRKLALFIRDKTLVTIHRAELPHMFNYYDIAKLSKITSTQKLLISLCKSCVLTYDKALEDAEKILETIDGELQTRRTSEASLIKLHETRRKLSTLKRLLWHTSAVIQRLPTVERGLKASMQDLRETSEGQLFFADELLEEANSLLNLQFSLASQKNNETIRLLTIFSAFFMPLTFIVGIYGMNFRDMPELQHPYGYSAVWFIMFSVVVAIWSWFKHKRWL